MTNRHLIEEIPHEAFDFESLIEIQVVEDEAGVPSGAAEDDVHNQSWGLDVV